MVDEERVGVLGHRVRGEDEPSLEAVFAGFNSEVGPAVEGLRRELLEELEV